MPTWGTTFRFCRHLVLSVPLSGDALLRLNICDLGPAPLVLSDAGLQSALSADHGSPESASCFPHACRLFHHRRMSAIARLTSLLPCTRRIHFLHPFSRLLFDARSSRMLMLPATGIRRFQPEASTPASAREGTGYVPQLRCERDSINVE